MSTNPQSEITIFVFCAVNHSHGWFVTLFYHVLATGCSKPSQETGARWGCDEVLQTCTRHWPALFCMSLKQQLTRRLLMEVADSSSSHPVHPSVRTTCWNVLPILEDVGDLPGLCWRRAIGLPLNSVNLGRKRWNRSGYELKAMDKPVNIDAWRMKRLRKPWSLGTSHLVWWGPMAPRWYRVVRRDIILLMQESCAMTKEPTRRHDSEGRIGSKPSQLQGMCDVSSELSTRRRVDRRSRRRYEDVAVKRVGRSDQWPRVLHPGSAHVEAQ